MKRLWSYFAIILLLTLIFAYRNYQSQQQFIQTVPNLTLKPTPQIQPPVSSPTPSEPKNQPEDLPTETISYQPNPSWQTYQDTQAGFTIQYPPYYELEERVEGDHANFLNCSGKEGPGFCTSGFRLLIYNNYYQGSRRAWLKRVYPPLYQPYFQNLIIDNQKALLAIEGNPGGSSALFVAIPNGTRMVVLTMSFVAWDPQTGRLPDLSFVKQILATFKFTD